MSIEELRRVVREALGEAVPGVELDDLDPSESFREELDMDSVDFLNFAAALSRRLEVDIPDVDTPKLSSFASTVSYLSDRLP